jgi:hypothetical protein
VAFQKTAEAEQATVLDEDGKVRRVFARLNKDEASELEILRTAKDMGMKIENLRDHCTATPSGLKRR